MERRVALSLRTCTNMKAGNVDLATMQKSRHILALGAGLCPDEILQKATRGPPLLQVATTLSGGCDRRIAVLVALAPLLRKET